MPAKPIATTARFENDWKKRVPSEENRIRLMPNIAPCSAASDDDMLTSSRSDGSTAPKPRPHASRA